MNAATYISPVRLSIRVRGSFTEAKKPRDLSQCPLQSLEKVKDEYDLVALLVGSCLLGVRLEVMLECSILSPSMLGISHK